MIWAGGTCFRLKGTWSHRCDTEEEKNIRTLATIRENQELQGSLKNVYRTQD